MELQMNGQGGYGEVKFWWKGDVDGREQELVVRGYVNAATGGPPVVLVRRNVGNGDAVPPKPCPLTHFRRWMLLPGGMR